KGRGAGNRVVGVALLEPTGAPGVYFLREGVSKMTDTMRREFAGGSAKVRKVVDRVVEDVAELSGTARRALGETASRAGHVAHDIADEAVVQSRRAARAAVDEVREHPVRSVAIGAAVGVLVAAFLTRRR